MRSVVRHPKSFDIETLREDLIEMYVDQKLPMSTLCQRFHLTAPRILKAFERWGIQKRSRSDILKSTYNLRRVQKSCKGCGTQILGTYNQRSCENCLKLLRNAKYRQTKYGLHPEQFDELLVMQNSSCALCKKAFDSIKEKYASIHVDHSHETGKVRGLLCGPCNRALGIVEKKSAEWLRNAIRYAKVKI